MIKWCPQKFKRSLEGAMPIKVQQNFSLSYPGSCYAFWTGFGVGAKISEALSAEP